MIRRLLALDGVYVVCRFRDDGALVEGYGVYTEEGMARLAKFAHDYRRMVQGNADQLSMFTGMRGWTPPRAWVLRGDTVMAVGVANIACVVRNDESVLNEILFEMQEVSRW